MHGHFCPHGCISPTDGFAATAALAILTDISLRSILLRSISLVAPYAHTSLHASMRLDGRTALDLYNKKKPPPLNSQKRKPFRNILSTVSSYHSGIGLSIMIYCGFLSFFNKFVKKLSLTGQFSAVTVMENPRKEQWI